MIASVDLGHKDDITVETTLNGFVILLIVGILLIVAK